MNTQRVGLCAVCANDRIGQMREHEGRTVFVCNACENEHPRAGRYGFDVGGRAPGGEHGNVRGRWRGDKRHGGGS